MKGKVAALVFFFFTCFTFVVPEFQVKELGHMLGPGTAGATTIGSTDLSSPTGTVKFAWARIAGRDDAVYLQIPSNQLSNRVILPQSPAPVILAKFDPSTNTGEISVMRIREMGGQTAGIQAMILKMTPSNLQHYMSTDLYNFAWLDWNGKNANGNEIIDPTTGATCDSEYSQKYLLDNDPPQGVVMDDIVRAFHKNQNATFTFDSMTQAKINRSSLYWHQRLNTDPCWIKRGFKAFDTGDGLFHNISQGGFYKLVALAQTLHKAPIAFIAIPEIKQHVTQTSSGDLITKTVTTTVTYTLTPRWTVSTPVISGQMAGYLVNTTQDPHGNYSFVPVQSNGSFPMDPMTIYQYTESQTGFTGLFVFIAVVAIGALTGGAGWLAATGEMSLGTVAAGAGAGAIGGLVATGFSPTTSTTAEITPFQYSSYSLDPSINWSGDQKVVSNNTKSQWLSPDFFYTPPTNGGVQLFASQINFEQAIECGGASQVPGSTTAITTCAVSSTPAIITIPMSDSRFKSVINEMFSFPQKTLQQYTYPYTTN